MNPFYSYYDGRLNSNFRLHRNSHFSQAQLNIRYHNNYLWPGNGYVSWFQNGTGIMFQLLRFYLQEISILTNSKYSPQGRLYDVQTLYLRHTSCCQPSRKGSVTKYEMIMEEIFAPKKETEHPLSEVEMNGSNKCRENT